MLHQHRITLSSSWRQFLTFFAQIKRALSLRVALVLTALFLTASHSYAQDITIPDVNIDGIDENSTGDEILIKIIKLVFRIGIWVGMIVAGLLSMKSIVKSVNEQKANDQGRWGAVLSDSIGSIITAIAVIAIGAWVLTFLE